MFKSHYMIVIIEIYKYEWVNIFFGYLFPSSENLKILRIEGQRLKMYITFKIYCFIAYACV